MAVTLWQRFEYYYYLQYIALIFIKMILYYRMLQHWANEGEFYTCGFVLLKFIEPVTFVHCTVTSLYYANKPVTFARCPGETGRMDVQSLDDGILALTSYKYSETSIE